MNKKRIYSWILVIIWMIIIFMVSHVPTDASYEASKEVISNVVGSGAASGMVLNGTMTLNKFVRKLAHVGEYFMLGILLMNALSKYNMSNSKVVVLCNIIGCIYACSDELHQLLIGRSGTITDIVIDSIGVLIAIVAFICFKVLSSKDDKDVKFI